MRGRGRGKGGMRCVDMVCENERSEEGGDEERSRLYYPHCGANVGGSSSFLFLISLFLSSGGSLFLFIFSLDKWVVIRVKRA